MIESTGGPYRFIKFGKQQDVDQEEAKKIVSNYGQNIPLSSLPPPSLTIVEEQQTFNNDLSSTMNQFKEDEKHVEIGQRQVNNCNKLTAFAKSHPILTAGIVAGILLFLVGAGIAVHALMGHATLTLFHQQVALGGGIAIMAIYYGVCLVNMARRTALKDEAQKQLESAEKLKEQIGEKSEKGIENIKKELNGRIALLQQKKIQEYNKAVEIKAVIKKYRDQLLKLTQNSVPTSQLPYVNTALERANVVINAPTLHFEPEQPELPFIAEIVIPDVPTLEMKKNAQTAEQMQGSFSKLVHFVKENPGSLLLMLGGLAIAALGGYGAYLYLHGASSLYFFGTLSVTTIAPFMIYGLSLAYEGYFNSETNRINKQLESLNRKDLENLRKISEGGEILEKIKAEGEKVIQSLGKEWANYQGKQGIDVEAVGEWERVKGVCEGILGMLGELPVESQKALNSLSQPYNYVK